MRSLLLPAVAAAVLSGAAVAQVDVLTTIPDLADLVRAVGGEHVDVDSIAEGTENVHGVPVRPSHLVAASRADLFVQIGLSLEHAFVPGLLERARNRAILPGSPGFVDVSVGFEAIQVPEAISREAGADLHPQGNPHINLDPRFGRHAADRILEGLVRVDPEREAAYRRRHAALLEELARAEERWAEAAGAFRGRKVAAYHRDFDYFAHAYDMQVVDTVEPKPGVPPKPRDLAETVRVLREERVPVLVTARWSRNDDVRFVAERSGARLLEIPVMVHGVRGVDSWIGMMDHLHASLAEAYGGDEDEPR